MKIIKKLLYKYLSTEIIDDLFLNIVEQSPTSEEKAKYISEINQSLYVSSILLSLLKNKDYKSKMLRFFASDIVRSLYRVTLNREPDQEGFESHQLSLIATGRIDEVLSGFISSEEFKKKHLEILPYMHLSMPPMINDYDKANSEQLNIISDKIKKAWENLGNSAAHHSVLTNDEFLPNSLEKNIGSFWKSGDKEVKEIEAILKRHGMKLNEVNVAIEYGCGVGRITVPLSKKVSAVHAYDISSPHLDYAKEHANEERAIINFHLVSDPLDKLQQCDLFYSRIVFQHNPPPIILQLIKNALESLNPGGIAIFQVPTYISGYSFILNDWLNVDHALDMQMHCIPQTAIFELVKNKECSILEIREDNWCGEPQYYLSNTFVIVK